MRERVATPSGIIDELEALHDYDWRTGYSFAHIVTGDQNLSRRHILYCLRPDWIASCVNQEIFDEFRCIPDLLKLEDWEINRYGAIIERMTKTISLLDWLLEIDEEILEAAEELYRELEEKGKI